MAGYAVAGPPLNDFPPLGSETHNPDPQLSHARQSSGPAARRNVSGDWRQNGTGNRERAATTNMPMNSAHGARSPPKSQYDMPWVPPNLLAHNYTQPGTSHVPCRFFPSGSCQAGDTCSFKHVIDERQDAQCKYFLKGNCKFGAKCALLHVLPNGKTLNAHPLPPQQSQPPPPPPRDLAIGNRINPMALQNQAQASALANSLSSGNYTDTFSHQIPTFQNNLPAYLEPPQSPQMDPQQYARSPIPIGLSARDAPFPSSFDSEGISYIAINGPVAASMPGKLMGPFSPPASLPKPIPKDTKGRQPERFDLGSSPENNLEVPGARLMHSQRVPNTRRMAASLPRNGHNFDPSWEQGNEIYGEDLLPGDLSNLMTPEERSRRLSGKVDNGPMVRESLRDAISEYNRRTKVGSPSNGQSPSRYGEWFKQQAQTGSPEFQPVSSPLAGPHQPGHSPSLNPFSLGGTSWSNHKNVSNLSEALARTSLNARSTQESQILRPGYGRVISSPRSAFDRVASGGSHTNTINEDVPAIFDLEGLDEEIVGSNATSKPIAINKPTNIWDNAGLQQRRIVPAVPFFDKRPIGSKLAPKDNGKENGVEENK